MPTTKAFPLLFGIPGRLGRPQRRPVKTLDTGDTESVPGRGEGQHVLDGNHRQEAAVGFLATWVIWVMRWVKNRVTPK